MKMIFILFKVFNFKFIIIAVLVNISLFKSIMYASNIDSFQNIVNDQEKIANQKHAIMQMKLTANNEASLNALATKSVSSEFVEHPTDTYVTKLLAYVRCSAKNTQTAYIECNNKIITVKNDTNLKEPLKMLVATIKRKDIIEFKQSSSKSKQYVCVCVAITENNEKIFSKKAVIRNAFLEEEFQFEPIDETSYEGDSVELRCDPPRGEPSPSIYWLKNNQVVDTKSESSRFKLSNDNSLLILVVNKDDAGNYICVAHNLMDKRFSKPAKLTVLDGDRRYVWSDWSEWSLCSVECGEGIIRRTRRCQNIINGQNVSDAFCSEGHSVEEEPCLINLCSNDAKWSQWQPWSVCTPECKQYRKRHCEANGDITDEKECEKGERLQIRNCTTTKLCKEKFNHISPRLGDFYDDQTPKPYQISSHDQNGSISSTKYIFDKNMLSFILGIAGGLFILVILIIIIIFIVRRKNPKKSELNLYYTCEQPYNSDSRLNFSKKPVGYFRASLNDVNQSLHDSKGLIYNTCVERQLLLNNLPQFQKYNNNSNNNHESIYFYNTQNNEYEQASSMLHLDRSINIIKNSMNSLSNLHTQGEMHKESPTNFTTTTTVDSGTTTSSSSYYATPNHDHKINDALRIPTSAVKGSIKSSHKNPVRFDIDLINNTNNRTKRKTYNSNKFASSILSSAHSSPSLATPLESPKDSPRNTANIQYGNKQLLSPGTASKSTPNLINNLLNNIVPSDICVETIGSNGGKLGLDCGITLLIPEDAISVDQLELMYLAICRHESTKPKLNEKASSLSTVIVIGPPSIVLMKPVLLIIDHCIENANEDWNISLFTSPNDENFIPTWTEELNDMNSENLNTFLNVTDKHFILMTDRLCRYSLTGQPKHINHRATKFMRLVAYCSSCITSDNFNLRIYCIDDLFVALQEILRDEEKIGGTMMDTSESFPVAYGLSAGDKICISVEDVTEGWGCKYNVNKQEIPVNHIWNGRNHLLHCAFTIERLNSSSEQFNCKIKAFQSSRTMENSVSMDISYSIQNNYCNNSLINKSLNSSCNWLRIFQQSFPHKVSKNYYQLDKSLKQQLCQMLDIPDTNWKILAEKLDIYRNLTYFDSKKSPTDILLLYLEAIDYLRLSKKSSNKHTNAHKILNLIQNEKLNQYLPNELLSQYILNFNENNQIDLSKDDTSYPIYANN